MSRDPFEEGARAARLLIPAAANPYPPDTDQANGWAAGHASVASAIEAGESEGG
jgi:hypothetical protein